MAEIADPSEYIEPYDEDDIEERFLALIQECQNYLNALNKLNHAWDLRFDPFAILSVAKSALDDIWRYKSYHLRDPQKLSDGIKRAAYFTKWIIKSRPIYFSRFASDDAIEDKSFDQDGRSLMINEAFAIVFSLITLATELGVRKIYLDEDFHSNLIYDLHYRNISTDALLAIYEIIRNAASDKSVVIKVLRDSEGVANTPSTSVKPDAS